MSPRANGSEATPVSSSQQAHRVPHSFVALLIYPSARSLALSSPTSPLLSAPLALISFGMTTAMFMWITTTWTGGAMESTAAFYAIAFGGIGQLLAGILNVGRYNMLLSGAMVASYPVCMQDDVADRPGPGQHQFVIRSCPPHLHVCPLSS